MAMIPPLITFDHQLFLTHSKKGKVAEFHFHSGSAFKQIRSVNLEARIANSVFYLTVFVTALSNEGFAWGFEGESV